MQVHQTPQILLTRPSVASARFAEGLEGLADVVIAPLMEITGTGAPVALDGISALILTSENAVAFAPPAPITAYCVGPRTAEAARAAGFTTEIMGPDADGLVHTLSKRRQTGVLLHLHGVHTRGDVAERLTTAGVQTRGIAVYDQKDVPPTQAFRDALNHPALIVPLFSPRSAGLFAKAAPDLRSDTRLLALSPAVAQALPADMQAQTQVVPAPNGAEMLAALAAMTDRRNSP